MQWFSGCRPAQYMTFHINNNLLSQINDRLEVHALNLILRGVIWVVTIGLPVLLALIIQVLPILMGLGKSFKMFFSGLILKSISSDWLLASGRLCPDPRSFCVLGGRENMQDGIAAPCGQVWQYNQCKEMIKSPFQIWIRFNPIAGTSGCKGETLFDLSDF